MRQRKIQNVVSGQSQKFKTRESSRGNAADLGQPGIRIRPPFPLGIKRLQLCQIRLERQGFDYKLLNHIPRVRRRVEHVFISLEFFQDLDQVADLLSAEEERCGFYQLDSRAVLAEL